MVGQPHQNFMKMASWSSVSEHLVNPIGMSDQLKWNNHCSLILFFSTLFIDCLFFLYRLDLEKEIKNMKDPDNRNTYSSYRYIFHTDEPY